MRGSVLRWTLARIRLNESPSEKEGKSPSCSVQKIERSLAPQ